MDTASSRALVLTSPVKIHQVMREIVGDPKCLSHPKCRSHPSLVVQFAIAHFDLTGAESLTEVLESCKYEGISYYYLSAIVESSSVRMCVTVCLSSRSNHFVSSDFLCFVVCSLHCTYPPAPPPARIQFFLLDCALPLPHSVDESYSWILFFIDSRTEFSWVSPARGILGIWEELHCLKFVLRNMDVDGLCNQVHSIELSEDRNKGLTRELL